MGVSIRRGFKLLWMTRRYVNILASSLPTMLRANIIATWVDH